MVCSTASAPAVLTVVSRGRQRDGLGSVGGGFGHRPDDREHGAFDGLAHGPVGGVGSRPQGVDHGAGVEGLSGGDRLAGAAHDLRQDDARVAAGAHQRAPGDDGHEAGKVVDRSRVGLVDNRLHGEEQVGAGVASGTG